ncbi:hypothetical protein GCM10010425_74420 [Streptomyces spororaveus]|uniref:Uncharacterized protein n=1 Tax=Streptomyces spororaveus TaxID=284039 RepID=A0ABQ3T254_9ACTN|nr:hypothetical protein [Streptomyces spororaveus]GHI74468.1 hypothetical protein Sspor_00290 [Streptomyces spororaveus]
MPTGETKPSRNRGVEIDPADTEPAGSLVRAERNVPVEQGGPVPAARERIDLVRVDVGELDFATKVTRSPARTR